jgi:hypothetical protein
MGSSDESGILTIGEAPDAHRMPDGAATALAKPRLRRFLGCAQGFYDPQLYGLGRELTVVIISRAVCTAYSSSGGGSTGGVYSMPSSVLLTMSSVTVGSSRDGPRSSTVGLERSGRSHRISFTCRRSTTS